VTERRRAKEKLAAASRVLVIGIGGGGDVVGALAAAEAARALGTDAVVGGLTWERRPVDPLPGPRHLREITGAQPLHAAVALAGPHTTGPGGFRFCEADMAAFLGEPTVLVDPNPGPASPPAWTSPPPTSAATSCCCSTSAATSWPTATSRGWPARSPTPPS
jgi:hypothetical protein